VNGLCVRAAGARNQCARGAWLALLGGPSTSPLDDCRCAVPSFAGHLTCTTASARHYEIAVP